MCDCVFMGAYVLDVALFILKSCHSGKLRSAGVYSLIQRIYRDDQSYGTYLDSARFHSCVNVLRGFLFD